MANPLSDKQKTRYQRLRRRKKAGKLTEGQQGRYDKLRQKKLAPIATGGPPQPQPDIGWGQEPGPVDQLGESPYANAPDWAGIPEAARPTMTTAAGSAFPMSIVAGYGARNAGDLPNWLGVQNEGYWADPQSPYAAALFARAQRRQQANPPMPLPDRVPGQGRMMGDQPRQLMDLLRGGM